MTPATEEFNDFVRARHERLCRVAYVLCGDWQHAEDIVQTALAKTYVAFRRGHVESLDAYAHRAVVNTRASFWRRRWHGEVATGALPESSTTDPYAAVDRRGAVVAALGTLPPLQRKVLALRFLADLSEADTALALGCSVGTVKSRTSRALATLRATGLLADPNEQVTNHA
jgi:RNA polymerase sigma-70 factor (sigma-E family)